MEIKNGYDLEDEIGQGNFARDRIVVLGRPQAGKTVYLSLLYEHAWNSCCSFKMKALKGVHHESLIKSARKIKKKINSEEEQFLPRTIEVVKPYLEIQYDGKSRTMVSLDYSGEVFQQAFIKDNHEKEEVKELLEHIDRAQSIILLVDPSHLVEDEGSGEIDNTYGMLKAIERVKNWPNGNEVPIVLVVTKTDKNQELLTKNGGTVNFIKKNFRNLIETTKNLKLCKISALYPDGTDNNHQKHACAKLEAPLTYCLDIINENEKLLNHQKERKRMMEFQKKLDTKEKRNGFLALGIAVILLILLIFTVYRLFPKTIWFNLRYNIFGW
jgi:GTPase SAR1 family protein